MTKRFWIVGASLVVCGCLLAALSSRAADKDKPTAAPAADKDKPAAADPQEEGKSSEVADAVSDIVTAYKLADWGRRMEPQSPFALCTAAEILNRTTLLPGADAKDRVTVTAADSGAKQEKPDTDSLKAEAKALLEEAKKMAKANKQDVAAVDAMADIIGKHRGGLNGPLMFTMVLRPGQTDTYNIKFKRGEWARICVRHAEDNIMDLHAADQYGHDRAADWARNPVISFLVRQGDGTDYKVTVRNARGHDAVTYQLFTN